LADNRISGWPDMSYGTLVEKLAIENFISENGKYRVLIAPDKMKINGQNN
jgi:hypothetical protein